MRCVATRGVPAGGRRRIGAAAVVVAAVIAVGVLPDAAAGVALQLLQARFSQDERLDWQAVRGIIVPGGGGERVEEALRLAARHPHLMVVLSGPGHGELARARAAALEPGRLLIEGASRTTYDNARHVRALLGPMGEARWVLVTSAAHMPRAMGAFHRVGLPVEPWPLPAVPLTPAQTRGIAGHELLGLLGYWLSGRSSSLLPAAADVPVAPGRDRLPS